MAETNLRRERRGLAIGLVAVAFVILCGLGTWQVQRLAWKQDLVSRVEARTELPPSPAPDPGMWEALDFDEVDFLPVEVSGTFRHDQEIHAYAALSSPAGPLDGQGYFVLTPLVTDAGWIVIVNRGFVPEDRKDSESRAASQIDGTVEIVGLLRPPQGRNSFTPDNDVAANIWFTRDPAAIGEALALDADILAPYYIDAFYDPDMPGGIPQGGETIIAFSNNHLQYAITWYGLAAALLAIAVLRLRRRGAPPQA